MWEAITHWSGWGTAGTGLAWIITSCLLIAGLVGCIVPILPGHLILLIAAIAHRLMLGRDASGMEWWTFVILTLLMALSSMVLLPEAARVNGREPTYAPEMLTPVALFSADPTVLVVPASSPIRRPPSCGSPTTLR